MASDREQAEADAIARAQAHNALRVDASEQWKAADAIHKANEERGLRAIDGILQRRNGR